MTESTQGNMRAAMERDRFEQGAQVSQIAADKAH